MRVVSCLERCVWLVCGRAALRMPAVDGVASSPCQVGAFGAVYYPESSQSSAILGRRRASFASSSSSSYGTDCLLSVYACG